MSDFWAGTAYGLAELGSDGVAPELSATTGGIRDKEDGACAECIPSSPGNGVSGLHRHHPTDAVNRPQEREIAGSKTSGMLIEELINAVVRAEERAER